CFFYFFELLGSAIVTSSQHSCVVLLKSRVYCLVQLCKAIVMAAAHFYIYPGIKNAHGVFHQCLVARSISPGGQNSSAIMFCKIRKGLIHRWLIFATLVDGTLEIIRYNGCRYASIKMQGIFTGSYKVFFLLAHHGF